MSVQCIMCGLWVEITENETLVCKCGFVFKSKGEKN